MKLSIRVKFLLIILSVMILFILSSVIIINTYLADSLITKSKNNYGELIESFRESTENIFINSVKDSEKLADEVAKWYSNTDVNNWNQDYDEKYYSDENNAIRTKYNENDEISGVFISSDYGLSDENKKMILATETKFDYYSKSSGVDFLDTYIITPNQLLRIYPKGIESDFEANTDFNDHVFYNIATPENNPEKQSKWTPMYYDPFWKYWMISNVTPIYQDNTFLGIIGHDIVLNSLLENMTEKEKKIKNSQHIIIAKDGTLIYHPDYFQKMKESPTTWENESKKDELLLNEINKYSNEISSGEYVSVETKINNKTYLLSFSYMDAVDWYYVQLIPMNDVLSDVNSLTLIIIIIFSIIVIIVILIIIIMFNVLVIGPIKKLTNKLKDISEGEGDLTKRIEVKSKDEIGELARYFNKFVDNLNDMIVQIKASMTQINLGISQISDSTQHLSDGTSKQAASMEEITATVNEISAQIQQSVENIKNTYSISEKTRDNSAEGDKLMNELVIAMEKINNSASDIKKIVNVIDDIAFQTNLLALNADIEAERVGKYGRGFAVVASSVRTLAGRSAEAVKDTTERIEEVINNIKKGNDLVKQTADKFKDISNGAEGSTHLVGEILESSEEQSNGVKQISSAMGSIEEVVQTNSANAEENAASSEELASQTKEVINLISYFKVEEKDKNPQNYIKEIDANQITPELLDALEQQLADRNRKQIKPKEED
jgi:methyl-accepting chemotaxis protein